MTWPQRAATHWLIPCCRSMMPAMSAMLFGTIRCPAQRESHRALHMPTPKVKMGLAAMHPWVPACQRTWGAHQQSHVWRAHAAKLDAACCQMAALGKRTAATCSGQGPALGSGLILTENARPAGVMGFDSSGGFYLQHSTPRFPDDPVKGAHKSSGEYTGVLPVDLPRSKICTSYQDAYSRNNFCT